MRSQCVLWSTLVYIVHVDVFRRDEIHRHPHGPVTSVERRTKSRQRPFPVELHYVRISSSEESHDRIHSCIASFGC